MKFFRNADTGEPVRLHLEARDTLEEMAAQAPMTMDELAAKIESIILGCIDYDDLAAAREDAVKEYKRLLVAWLQTWAEEEEKSTRRAFLKPAPLLRQVAEQIEAGDLV